LSRFFLHEYRDTHAAFMITAGVNAKAFSTYMGHSTITMTRRGRSPELGSDIPKLAEYLDTCETSRRTQRPAKRGVAGEIASGRSG
jgi:integrase